MHSTCKVQQLRQPQCLVDVQCALDKNTCGAHTFIQDEEMFALSVNSVTKSACLCEELGDQSGNCTLSVADRTHNRSRIKACRTEHTPDHQSRYGPRQPGEKDWR